jgi:hypothetical protein
MIEKGWDVVLQKAYFRTHRDVKRSERECGMTKGKWRKRNVTTDKKGESKH